MAAEITLLLDESRVQFIKEYAEQMGITASEIVDDYLKLLQKADAAYKKENIDPRVAAVSGIVRKRVNSDSYDK